MNPYKIAKYLALFVNLSLAALQLCLIKLHLELGGFSHFWITFHGFFVLYFAWFGIDRFKEGCRLQREWNWLSEREEMFFRYLSERYCSGMLSPDERVNWKRDGF